MSENASYFKIGLFVIFAVILLVAGIVVFGSGAFDPEPFIMETYFGTSVMGLEVGAKVLFRGVLQGEVTEISFARDVYYDDLEFGSADWFTYGSYVVVRIAFYPPHREGRTREQLEGILQTMVDNGLRVRLATRGVTGIKSLNGDVLDPTRYPAFEAKWEPDHFYIPSAPSTFASIETSLDTLTKKLQAVDFDKLFRDFDNLVNTATSAVNDLHTESLSQKLESALTDFRGTIERVDAILDDPNINAMLAEASKFTKTLNSQMNTGEIRSTLVNIDTASEDLPELVAQLNRTLRNLNNLVSSQSRDVAETLANLRLTAENLRQLTDTVKRYPSYGLFGNPPVKSTPGNPR